MENISRPQLLDYEACRSVIYRIKRNYPFVGCQAVGRSLTGRALFGLSLGQAARPVLFAAGFHGQEWMTSLIVLRFFERLCESVVKKAEIGSINAAGALAGRELIVVPCVNPDGAQIAIRGLAGAGCCGSVVQKISGGDLSGWNANARGVDINHNFDAGWDTLQRLEREAGITGPAPRQYGGTSPESEPETKAVTRLCRIRRPRHAAAFHSQGEEIYWQYGENNPPGAEEMAKVFAATSGYTLIENDGLASHGGFKDWFIEEFNRPAFTFEIGKGKNPLPLGDFENIYAALEKTLVLAAIW